MLKLLLRIFVLVFSSIPICAQNTGMFQKSIYKHASVGICLLDVPTGKMVTNLNAQQSLVPASVVKLITTATALEILGPDYRIETRLEYTGSIVNGVLTGDLIVRGGGDPSLGSRQVKADPEDFLKNWVRAVKAAGISEIHGRIVADASIFDEEPVSPYWLWEDMGNYFAAGIYGIAVFDNSFQLELSSGAVGTKPKVLSVKPSLPDLMLDNHLTAADNNLDSAYFYGAPYQLERRLFGTIPANRSSFVIKGDMPDPPSFLVERLRNVLVQEGIAVIGKACSLRLLSGAENIHVLKRKVLYRTYSIPLSGMIRIIHEKSDNLYTEYLLRHLALSTSNKPASARNGLRVVRDFWKQKGLDVSALCLSDACGLSPNDRVSAGFLAQVLHYMSVKSKYASVYELSLPLAGREGSVSGFLKGTTLEGRLRLKSGSIQSVTSYAGYYTIKGRLSVVVLIVNNADAPRFQIRKDMEDFLLSL